jgi:hypothetical protein
MPNLIIETNGRVVLLVHNGLPYADDEWRSILEIAGRADLSSLRVLVYDEGAAIDSAQRRDLIAAMGGRMPMCAVISQSRVSRGVATAIGWFKPGIRAFTPEQFDQAARHLGLTDEEREATRISARHLRARVARRSA